MSNQEEITAKGLKEGLKNQIQLKKESIAIVGSDVSRRWSTRREGEQMQDDGVHTAFELILEEIGNVSKELKQEAKRLVDKGDFDSVSQLMNTGKGLDSFQLKVRSLQTEWINTFDPTTRSKTHFEQREVELPPSETLALTMTSAEAFAEAEYLGRSVRLLAGSTIRKASHESLGDHILQKKKNAISKGDIVDSEDPDLYKVIKPITFGSPSAAVQFVAGCSVSGPREWQVKGKGKSLKYWLYKQK